MAYLISQQGSNSGSRFILYIVVITIIVIGVVLLWIYIIQPYINGTLFPSSTVACTVAPATPTSLVATASGNTARVSWNPTSNTDNYILYLGQNPNFTTATATRTIKVIGTSIAVQNLLPTTYYLFVVSSNSCGASTKSGTIPVIITTFPSQFQLCKKDNPLLCLLMQSNGAEARLSQSCPTNECVLKYPNLQNISNSDGSLCLFENNPGGIVIEQPLLSKTCTAPTVWNYDQATEKVFTPDGLCLGADDSPESTVYNTTCSQLSNTEDPRYVWVIQPITL